MVVDQSFFNKDTQILKDTFVNAIYEGQYGETLTVKPHYIRHLASLPWFAELAEQLKERARETLIINLFAKAICRANGHDVITTDYALCSHFREYKDAIVSVRRNGLEVAKHFVEESALFETGEKGQEDSVNMIFLKLLADQFGKHKVVLRFAEDDVIQYRVVLRENAPAILELRDDITKEELEAFRIRLEESFAENQDPLEIIPEHIDEQE